MSNAIENCLEAILRRISPEALPKEFSLSQFPAMFASLGWRLRHLACKLSDEESATLREFGLVALEELSVADIARIHLLRLALNRLATGEQAGFVDALFRTGDNKEREVLLRGLMLLPLPEQFLATAIDACRAAVQTTFEAIACENAYPEKYFYPEAFRAMVLKALHLGVPLHRIHGLEKRKDQELSRMATDYASELNAAGRAVPADIANILSNGGVTA